MIEKQKNYMIFNDFEKALLPDISKSLYTLPFKTYYGFDNL